MRISFVLWILISLTVKAGEIPCVTIEEHLAHPENNSTTAFIRLIQDASSRFHPFSAEAFEHLREGPINPALLMGDSVNDTERYAYRKGFDELLKTKEVNWDEVREALSARGKEAEAKENQRQKVEHVTSARWKIEPTKSIETGTTGDSPTTPLQAVKSRDGKAYGLVSGEPPAVINLVTEHSILLPKDTIQSSLLTTPDGEVLTLAIRQHPPSPPGAKPSEWVIELLDPETGEAKQSFTVNGQTLSQKSDRLLNAFQTLNNRKPENSYLTVDTKGRLCLFMGWTLDPSFIRFSEKSIETLDEHGMRDAHFVRSTDGKKVYALGRLGPGPLISLTVVDMLGNRVLQKKPAKSDPRYNAMLDGFAWIKDGNDGKLHVAYWDDESQLHLWAIGQKESDFHESIEKLQPVPKTADTPNNFGTFVDDPSGSPHLYFTPDEEHLYVADTATGKLLHTQYFGNKGISGKSDFVQVVNGIPTFFRPRITLSNTTRPATLNVFQPSAGLNIPIDLPALDLYQFDAIVDFPDGRVVGYYYGWQDSPDSPIHSVQIYGPTPQKKSK